MNPQPPVEFVTSPENNLLIMAAYNEILFWERMKILMPMVERELIKAGVKFPKKEASHD